MPIIQLLKDPIYLTGFLLGLTIGITIHEFSHAWMAMKLGDYTAKYMGRVSLNPTRHIDILGLFFLLFAGFGWGKPVPINPNALKRKSDELKIALAGPVSNLVVSFIIMLVLNIYLRTVHETGFYDANPFTSILKIIAEINVVLAIFNIIPIPPLDGSKILKALVSFKARAQIEYMERSGFGIILLLILVSLGIISSAVGSIFSVTFMSFNAIIGIIIDFFVRILDIIVSIF